MSTNRTERQSTLVALLELTAANLGAGNEVTCNLPTDAFVIDVAPYVSVGFNGTSPIVNVTDGTTTFVSNEAAATSNALLATDNKVKFYPSGGTITASLGGSSVTTGRAVIAVQYVRLGRSHEIQG